MKYRNLKKCNLTKDTIINFNEMTKQQTEIEKQKAEKDRIHSEILSLSVSMNIFDFWHAFLKEDIFIGFIKPNEKLIN